MCIAFSHLEQAMLDSQDGSGSYSGIWVIGTGVTVGDDVTVEGVMGNLSDLLAITQSAVTVNSSGNTLPEAEVLTTLALQDDSWEGVLATTTGTCTATANNYNEWSIDDSSGALLVDDLGYEFAQEVVDGIYTVTSPVYYSFGAFKLVPMSSDYVGLADACSVVTCDAPPAAACIGNELLTYPAEGSCSDGACTYAVTNTDCGDSATCTDGANGSLCVDNSVDLCADVVCEAPPADTCDGNASITYPAVGSCDATGACTYEAASTDCGDATCVDGVCSSVSIVISEIHYNPGSDQGSDNDYEFIELYNAGDTVDLAGFQVTTALNHTFTSYTFQSGSYLVLAKNAASFADLGDSVIQWDSGSINNTGETIVVQDASGVTLDTVSYEDGSPWPSAPDGSGPSLSLIDLTSDNSLPESWAESSVTGGTPGYAN